MAKAFLITGKICSGKTTYAKRLVEENNAVLLSSDEIMEALFGWYIGDSYDEIQEKVMQYLFKKSLEIIKAGVDVVLDIGFWSQEKRHEAKNFYARNEIAYEMHYIEVSEKTWKRNVGKRNKAVENAETKDVYIDDKLAHKCLSMYEVPTKDEIDVWYINDWM